MLLATASVTVNSTPTSPDSLPCVETDRSASIEAAVLSLSVIVVVALLMATYTAGSLEDESCTSTVSVFSKKASSVTATDKVPSAEPLGIDITLSVMSS